MQTVKEFIEKVKANGNKDVTLYMYPGQGHGFMNGGQDIHKMMKSKSSYPLSVMPVCVIAQQQNLTFPDCHLYCALRYSPKGCEVLWLLSPAATRCKHLPKHEVLTSVGNKRQSHLSLLKFLMCT